MMTPVPFEPDRSVLAEALTRCGKAGAAKAVMQCKEAPESRWWEIQKHLHRCGESEASRLLQVKIYMANSAMEAFA